MPDTAKDRFSQLLFYILLIVDGLPRLSGAQPIPRAAGLGGGVRDDVPGCLRRALLADWSEPLGPRHDAHDRGADRGARRAPRVGAGQGGAASHRLCTGGVADRARPDRPDLAGGAGASADAAARGPHRSLARRRAACPRISRAGGRRRRRRCAGDARQPVRDAVLVVLSAARRPHSRASDPRSAAASGARPRTPDDGDAGSRHRQRWRRADGRGGAGARRRCHLLGAGFQWARHVGRRDRVLFARAGGRLGIGVRAVGALAVSCRARSRAP